MNDNRNILPSLSAWSRVKADPDTQLAGICIVTASVNPGSHPGIPGTVTVTVPDFRRNSHLTCGLTSADSA